MSTDNNSWYLYLMNTIIKKIPKKRRGASMPNLNPKDMKSGLMAPQKDPRIKSVSKYMNSTILTGAPLNPPIKADWHSQIDNADWQMFGNSQYNDCVPAAFGHVIMQQTKYANKFYVPGENEVETFYGLACEPPAWYPGSGPGAGCIMSKALGIWFDKGIGSHKPTGYAFVDYRNVDEMRHAIATFGSVICGLALPQSAIAQWDNMTPWDINGSGNTSWGSWCIHAVLIVGYDSTTDLYDVVCWGRIQQMTKNFISWYMTEAYVVVSRDFVGSNGKTASNFNFGALMVDMMDPFERQIHALYVVLYGRAADDSGVSYWKSALKSHDPNFNNTYVYSDISVDDQIWLAQQFCSSQSTYFNTQYGSLDDRTFIQHLYMNMGGNMGDSNGVTYWVAKVQEAKNSGQSELLARAAVAGQFAHDFLTIDLSKGADAVNLSPEDYAAACSRQQQFQNRVAVSKFWTQESRLSNAGVLTINSTADRSFTASQHIVAVVTSDPTTLNKAEDAIISAVKINDLSPIFAL